MPRVVIDAATRHDGTLFAVSSEVPDEGREYASVNRLHVFDRGAWHVEAEWEGWLPTSLAVTSSFAVVAAVKRHLVFIRNGIVQTFEHPESERPLHCIYRGSGYLLAGGSAGYFLAIHPATGATTSHNLRDHGVEKPSRGIFAIAEYGSGLVFVGSHRLAVSLTASAATLLMPPGPTAATPNFHSVAALPGKLFVASPGALLCYQNEQWRSISLPPPVAAQIGALATSGGGLLLGGNEVVFLEPGGSVPPRVLYRHPSEAYVCTFICPSTSCAVFSDGTVVQLSGSMQPASSILEAGGA